MSSKYPYVSDQYKHLIQYSNISPQIGSNNNNYYQQSQYYPTHSQVQQHYAPQYQAQQYQNQQYRLHQQQPIVFLPGPQQQIYNKPPARFNHDSYAADAPNPQYPNLNQYNQQQYAKNNTPQTPQDQKQIIHKIEYGDTLQGLSLIYDIPISKIKQRNKIDGDSIYYLKEIVIPNPKTGPMQFAKTQQIMIQEFMNFMPMDERSDKVARYYLEDHQWLMDEAIKAFKQDLQWERKNKVKFGTIQINSKENHLNYSAQQLLIKKSI